MASGVLPKFRKVANERPNWYCLIIAIGVVSLATGARFWMHGTLGGAVPFILYYPAVMLAAWAGGFSCGFVATVLSGLAAHYFFIEPRYALAGSPPLVVALIVFVLSSLFISFLAELRLRAITRERTAVEREKESAARERHLRELLENEKRFAEQILSSIGDVFLVVGFDWRIVYANEHFARGALSSKKELEGQYVWKMIPHMEAVDRPHMEKVMTERVPVRFETYNRKTGAWYHVGVYPSEDGVTVYATDITARKKTEEKLRIAREQLNKHAQGLEAEVRRRTAELRESIAELESFSYTVSHDLRSPLRAMQGFAHMTLDEYGEQLGEGGRDYLRRIDSAAQRMDRLIQDVITFNQVARMEMRLEPVDTGNIVDEIIHQYPSVNKPHASFDIKSPLEQVSANPAALTQALSNLLTNAVKFVGRGEAAKVKVSTVKSDGRVSICIEDNGIGIQPEFLPKIFEPFHRAHPDAGYDGTGIGLAIAKKAVERMHGTLEVESEVGKGSKFSIQLKAP